jgi:hypothetical protein
VKRGPIIRAAALVFVIILIVAMFVGCAKYDGDKATFCRRLPEAPSFQSLLFKTSTGSSRAAAQTMRDAARDFRALEQSAPRSIRAKVAALGDSAERIGRQLADPRSQDGGVTVYGEGGRVVRIPQERPMSSIRTEAFYREFSAHPGTANAAIAMLTYAQKDCGIENLDSTLGLNGYGPIDTYTPYGGTIDGGGFGSSTSQPGGSGGPALVIPPAETAPSPTTSPPLETSSVPASTTTVSSGATRPR